MAETGRIVERLATLVRDHSGLPNEFRQHTEVAVAHVRGRLQRRELYVAVVGEKKAGKSTFLNALLGARVLPSGEREMTGTITYLRAGGQPDYSYVLVSGEQGRFATDCPDETPVFDEQLRVIDQEIERREARLTEGRLARERALGGQRLAVAAIEESVQLLTRRQKELEQHRVCLAETRAVELTCAEDEQRARSQLPTALQRRPPIWAVWWWFVRLLLSMFYREGRDRYRAAQAEHQGALAAVTTAEKTLAQQTTLLSLLEQSINEQQKELHRAQRDVDALAAALTDGTTALAALRDDRQYVLAAQGAHQGHRQREFFRHVEALCNMRKKGGEVRELCIWYPSPILPADVVFIDTPGVNTDNALNEERSLQAIGEADTCILLTSAKQAMSVRTRQFLETCVLPRVPHLILVLTKVDAARDDACDADGDVDGQVQETIDIAIDKFARSMGRRREQVLGFAVAAHRAIKDDINYQEGYASKFGRALERLLHVLQVERSHALGVRASRLIDQALRESEQAIDQAMESYRKSIGRLQRSRLPDPQAERQRITEKHSSQLRTECARAHGECAMGLQQEMHALRSEWLVHLAAASNKDELEKVVEQCKATVQLQSQQAATRVVDELQQAAKRLVAQHTQSAATEVRKRYEIVQAASGTEAPISVGNLRFDSGLSTQSLDTLNALLSVFSRKEEMAGGLGAGAGAAIGTALMPGIGTAIGAGVGLLLGALFGPNLDLLKRKMSIQIEAAFETLEKAGLDALQQADRQVVEQGRRFMSELLEEELRRFNHWIDSLIQRKEAEIATEQSHLADLKSAARELDEGRLRLNALIAQCTQESLALACAQPSR